MLGAASPYNFGGAFMYAEHELSWSLLPDDLPWEDGGPYISPRIAIDSDGDALVAGTYTHDFEIATAARTWVVGGRAGWHATLWGSGGPGRRCGDRAAQWLLDGGRWALNLDTYGPGGMGPGSDGNWITGIRGW